MARGFVLRWRSTAAAAIAVILAGAAFGVALTATASSQRYSRELSQQLVPAAAAAGDLLRGFTTQQASLRTTVSSGNLSGLRAYQSSGTEFLEAAAQLKQLASGDRPMTAQLNSTVTAYRGWLADVADPQLAAMRRGDIAAARALQADIAHVSPLTLAVRVSAMALESQITSEQQTATDTLNRVDNVLLGALIAMIMVVVIIAVMIILGVWRGLVRPFRRLNKAVAAVADGKYYGAIPTVGSADLADLSRGVELMRTRLVLALTEGERAKENLRNLFELAPDAMIALAGDDSVAMANARAGQLFGYRARELVSRPAQTLLSEESRSDLSGNPVVLTDRHSWPAGREVKADGVRRDGSVFPAEVRLSLLPTDQGILFVAAIRDVSERLAMEAEQERLRVAAEQERVRQRQRQSQRLESLGQLIGGIAHDFNNLLNVISGYADFAAEQLTDLAGQDPRVEPVLDDVRQVQTAAEQAIRVTRQLLTFAKSESVKPEVLDLNEVVENAGRLLDRSLGAHIELVVSAEPGLWRVEADRGQLEQVLVNLAVNAHDAMPGGGRLTIATGNAEVDAVAAEQHPGLEPGRYCRLAVSDTGTGMDAVTIERVFEPFFSTKPRGRGTGLGLATVYGIVSGLGGTIDIYSAERLGTTVSVLLPVTGQSGTRQPGTGQPITGAADAGRATPEAGGHGEMILLAEDEESLRTMASRILTRNGYQVCQAADGADAVRRAEDPAQHIDLLITDMVMPGMLGSEVVVRVRAVRPRVPAVFITGYAQQVLDFHGFRSPELDILQKPFTEAALLSHVRTALSRAGIPRQPSSPARESRIRSD
jgi:PAS domain S-box-containing protein